MAEVGVAHDWHVRPSVLGLCAPEEDLGLMWAYTDARSRMQGWEAQEHEREMKRKQPRGKK